MSITVKVDDVEQHFSELIAKVEAGEEIVIARGGLPIARLVPLPDDRRAEILRAVEGIRALRSRAARVTNDEISEWRHEGRTR